MSDIAQVDQPYTNYLHFADTNGGENHAEINPKNDGY